MLGATYEIRVAGLVPRALIQALGDVSVSEHEMRTVLTVSCADLAGLNACRTTPFWSIIVITLDILVVWALTAHGRDLYR
jgi:hypothetical protein